MNMSRYASAVIMSRCWPRHATQHWGRLNTRHKQATTAGSLSTILQPSISVNNKYVSIYTLFTATVKQINLSWDTISWFQEYPLVEGHSISMGGWSAVPGPTPPELQPKLGNPELSPERSQVITCDKCGSGQQVSRILCVTQTYFVALIHCFTICSLLP